MTAVPAVATAVAPPDSDGADWEALGAGGDEIRQFALTGLTRRLAIIGVPIESLYGAEPLGVTSCSRTFRPRVLPGYSSRL